MVFIQEIRVSPSPCRGDVNDVGLTQCCYERRAYLTPMPLVVPKGQTPHWALKVLQWCSPLPLGILGEFNQQPMLGLAGNGNTCRGYLKNDREEPPLAFTTFIEHYHHIISSQHLQVDISGLQAYTSV